MPTAALVFNIGVPLGVVSMSVGVGLIFGAAAALLAFGALLWSSTIIATAFAMRGRMKGE